jgi:hypothetical protein
MCAGVRRRVQRAVKHAVTRLVGEALGLALGVAAFLGRDTNCPAGQKPEPEHRRESSQISAAPGGVAPRFRVALVSRGRGSLHACLRENGLVFEHSMLFVGLCSRVREIH